MGQEGRTEEEGMERRGDAERERRAKMIPCNDFNGFNDFNDLNVFNDFNVQRLQRFQRFSPCNVQR
ncbi:MAG: hypothetical protein C4530_09970 [Desulfobacteraceae bacterium]|nr:MAG: hypothetical protein C4530_09970 [Desulfobacteraceae bacterium]